MRDLQQANVLMESIAKEIPEITPITPDDLDLFNRFFEREPLTHGNSWTYITQGMQSIGPYNLGYKYYDGKNLSAVFVLPRIGDESDLLFFWNRPMGKDIVSAIVNISSYINSTFNKTVYITKIFRSMYDELLLKGFRDISELPWHKEAIAEDDSFPEIISDVEETIESFEKNGRARKAYKRYERLCEILHVRKVTSEEDKKLAWEIVDSFFNQDLDSLRVNVSFPENYWNIVFTSYDPRENLFIIFYEDIVVGMVDIFLGYHSCGNGYASLTLRKSVVGIEDFAMVYILFLLKKEGYKYFNQGGSEKESLDFYKKKFPISKENQMYWCVLF